MAVHGSVNHKHNHRGKGKQGEPGILTTSAGNTCMAIGREIVGVTGPLSTRGAAADSHVRTHMPRRRGGELHEIFKLY